MNATAPIPGTVGDAPESYIDTMLRGIVGFELTSPSSTASTS